MAHQRDLPPSEQAATCRRPRLLFVITEDWFFASHFLERGAAAVRAGYEVAVATRPTTKVSLIESHGIKLIPIDFSRRFNNHGIIGQIGYRTPAAHRRILLGEAA